MPVLGAFVVPHPPLIIPEIGRGREKSIQKTIDSYKQIANKIKELEPDTIIISSPHSTMYSDYVHISPGINATGTFKNFGAEEVSFSETYDIELVNEIEKLANKHNFPAGTKGEKDKNLDHGTMVPLHFIRKVYKKGKIIRLGISGLSYQEHYILGQIIKEAIDNLNRRVVYIASGDLSHCLKEDGPYGFVKEGPIYDKKIMEILEKKEFDKLIEFDKDLCEKARECGHRSFIIMSGVLDGYNVESTVYSHEDITGVGYGICSYIPKERNEERKFLKKYFDKETDRLNHKYQNTDEFVTLAKKTIELYIKEGIKIKNNNNLPDNLLSKRAGIFVSIHKFGKLRGCIGTIFPVRNCIAEEIIENAISAAVHDYRFAPITEKELDYLDINVDELSELEPVYDINTLDPKKYGIVVSTKEKRGVLLPDIEGVNTVEEQIEICKRKGNINPTEEITIEKFTVIRHK